MEFGRGEVADLLVQGGDETCGGQLGDVGDTAESVLDQFRVEAGVGGEAGEVGVGAQRAHDGIVGGQRERVEAVEAAGQPDVGKRFDAVFGQEGAQVVGDLDAQV